MVIDLGLMTASESDRPTLSRGENSGFYVDFFSDYAGVRENFSRHAVTVSDEACYTDQN
jgi:hypothetical protein